jgi:mycothiol synthase
MEPVEVCRQVDEPDLSEITALVRRASRSADHPALSEACRLELELLARGQPVPGFAGLLVHNGANESLRAYAHVSHRRTAWAVEVVTDPNSRHLRAPLLKRAVELAAKAGGGPLQLFVPKPTDADDDMAASVGLAVERELYQMRRRLPLEPSFGTLEAPLAVRPFAPGKDEAALLAANNAAFASHPDQGHWDKAMLTEREAQAWFDPAGLLLLEQDGQVAGFCWTKIEPDAPATGEIYVLGVTPCHRGAGLGAALLAAGCRHLSEKGVSTVTLYVDGDNLRARRLYDAAGFVVDHVDRIYAGDLLPVALPGT